MQAGKPSDQIKVDFRISVIKPLHAEWIVKYYDYARSKPEMIINQRVDIVQNHLTSRKDDIFGPFFF